MQNLSLPLGKSILATWILALALPLGVAHAQLSSDPGVDGSSIRRSGGRRLRVGDGSDVPTGKLLRGSCTVVKSDNNPIEGPCVNTLLSLVDSQGAEAGEARTNVNGQFEFSVGDPNATYRVSIESKAYEMVSPSKLLRAGDKAIIKLRMK